MSLLNKAEYAARWLWDRAKEADRGPETQPGRRHGTTVRAAGDVLVSKGHVVWAEGDADDDATTTSSTG